MPWRTVPNPVRLLLSLQHGFALKASFQIIWRSLHRKPCGPGLRVKVARRVCSLQPSWEMSACWTTCPLTFQPGGVVAIPPPHRPNLWHS
jgi:hypothetical protein